MIDVWFFRKFSDLRMFSSISRSMDGVWVGRKLCRSQIKAVEVLSRYSNINVGLRTSALRSSATTKGGNAGHRYMYSTFNGTSTKNSASGKYSTEKKLPLWPRVKSAVSFSVSGILIVGATGLAGVVVYLILSELFSPSGDTQIFNRAVTKIEADTVARSLLQCNDYENSRERLKAYGETLHNDKWTRNRPIKSTRRIEKDGKEHYFMKFHVESNKKIGLVTVEARESEKSYQPDFISMYLDVSGHERYYLIKSRPLVVKPKGFLGVNWGPKRD
ncbi:Tim21p Ecym_6154 [Eremothecium cymbalariae DBVPG|uniref:Mitochondrial import inner membrane translocase subunit Tim21 n=1 Tax=Eremothecium cymbalariae (strain CBS 270.75 / DBVPG 7215 / KCTC 17166 / NRRL Y-17582) TaxID=931890 RepID=G8JV65_ERECY|nr:hypothetical protein Ecym_6154 [Eremothecium cymbalariae DBVPG\